MFTAFGVCSPDLWMTVFKWLKLRSIHPVVLVSVLKFWSPKWIKDKYVLCLTLCPLTPRSDPPVTDHEHSRAGHHRLQLMERGETFVLSLRHFPHFYRQFTLLSSLSKYCPRVLAELSELQELYDSDMVELINWIRWVTRTEFILKTLLMLYVTSSCFFRSQAPLATVFAGSPQILGMVKLCSGLAVTSLPLYSDINLLRRTENVSAV